jgi:nucleoside-diphosphate-sugar epimerase
LVQNRYETVILVRNKSSLDKIKHLDSSVFRIFNIDESSLELLYKTYPIKNIIHTAVSYGRNNDYTEVINTNLLLPIRLIEIGIKNNLSGFINTDSYYTKEGQGYSHLPHYTISKKSFDSWLIFFAEQIKVCNLRLEHIYGPRDDPKKFCDHIINCVAIEQIQKIDLTHGNQMRDFIYVKDAARAYINILRLMQRENFQYRKYDIGTGKAIRISEFVSAVKNISKSSTALNFGGLTYRNNEILSSCADITEIGNLGWKPEITLKNGIAATIAYKVNE